MNAAELFDLIDSLAGSREAGSDGNGVVASRLLAGIEYGQANSAAETKLRSAWKKRSAGGPTPLVLVADDPEAEGRLVVLGPRGDGPLRLVRTESLGELIARTREMGDLEAVRFFAQEIDRLDTGGIAGVAARGLGTPHLLGKRLPDSDRWDELSELAASAAGKDWRDALAGLGYDLERLSDRGYLASFDGRPVALIHPHSSPAEFSRLGEEGRLPEGALLAACQRCGAPWGILAAGPRMRLFEARETDGSVSRYLELDATLLELEMQPLLGLLSPPYLAEGRLDSVFAEARDYGSDLRLRLDRRLRQEVLPILGVELGRWAEADGRDLKDDTVRAALESAALTFVFRALFLFYAESAGYLPVDQATYSQKSITSITERAAEELEIADERDASLWRDVRGLVEAMRTGNSAWGVPPYNGDLFDASALPGAEVLEVASIPDRPFARALVALARNPEDPAIGVDFSGLEVGHLGHIYEGLLSLRLSIADRDLRYDERSDRYVAPAEDEEPDIRADELLWLTNEGGRKSGGVYYTRSELVRHLVRGAVRPALDRHLERIKALAEKDPTAAADQLFDFYVIDPACGSAHFLVEVSEEIANRIAALLGELALPKVRDQLEELRAAASRAIGIDVEDSALLKRLVLKRCVYGVDLSTMGAEIAKVSLWLASFVPGLSLAYLDHNVQVGNSLIGVARPEDVDAPGDEKNTIPMIGDSLGEAIRDAAAAASSLRQISDRTPDEYQESRDLERELEEGRAGAETLMDLWTAGALGFPGARDEIARRGEEIIAGTTTLETAGAVEAAREQRALHWPLAFPEVFSRERPGFDVVVGNPPWEEVTVEELAFFARYRPGLRSQSAAERSEQVAGLRAERPELDAALEAEREQAAALRSYLGPDAGYEGGAGDPDLYRYFCQRYSKLLRQDGSLGVVLPRSVFAAKGSQGFRAWMFENAPPRRVDFLLNSGRWAFDSEPRYTVALLVADLHVPNEDESFDAAGVAASAEEFADQAGSPGLRLNRKALGPGWEVPLLPSQAEADLLAKLRDAGPFPLGGGRWRCFPVAELHETNDAHLWKGATSGRSLWKGASFDQYDPHGADARLCPATDKVMMKVRKPRPGSGSLVAEGVELAERREAVLRTVDRARVAFRDVTNRTNSRTVLACLVPPEHFLTNKAPYLAFVEDNVKAEAACLAIMNSLPFDWQARRFVEVNLNFFILEGLRLPALDDDVFDALSHGAARLSCPDERFAEFAAATEIDCGPLDDDERQHLRAEIDALVAHTWGLTEEELEVVFADFTDEAVPSEYREAVRTAYRKLA